MTNYEKGFKFEVVNTGLIGIINSFYYDPCVRRKMYSVSFYETDGRHYMTATVYPDTIESNLKRNLYKEVR